MMLMAATSKAQTVLVNGVQYSQNDTVTITTQYANIEVISPGHVTHTTTVYVGATTLYPANWSQGYIVSNKPKLFRVNWFVGSTKSATYRVYLTR